MSPKERERRLSYARGQFKTAKLRAMLAFAEATTGIATLRKTQQGREPTAEEKERGEIIGWRDHSNEEKIQNALQRMDRHIHFMDEINDSIDGLLSEEIPSACPVEGGETGPVPRNAEPVPRNAG